MNKAILIPVWIISGAMFVVSGVYNNPVAGARWITFGIVSTIVLYVLGNRKKKDD